MCPAVSEHTVQNSKQQKKIDKIFKIKKQDGRQFRIIQKLFGCPLYIHNTKKGGVHMPPYIWMLPYVWMPHVCLMPLMFGWFPASLDVPHMPPCMFGHPIHLGALLCLDDVWMVLNFPKTQRNILKNG